MWILKNVWNLGQIGVNLNSKIFARNRVCIT